MSRHVIPNAPGSPKTCETVVGWDAPLETFFATCFDSAKPEDDSEVFWVGIERGELPTIGHLARALDEYGVALSVEVATKLGEDFQQEGKRFAGRPATGLLASMAESYAGPEQQARITAALTGQDQAGEGQ